MSYQPNVEIAIQNAGRVMVEADCDAVKLEGGDPDLDASRPHPSDILDYFREKDEIILSGDWDFVTQNFLDKIEATNNTARALTESGLTFIAATNLHL